MNRIWFLVLPIFFIPACLRIKEVSSYEFQRKIEELKQYKITDREKVVTFLGLDISKDNLHNISNKLKPNKVQKSSNLCLDLKNELPQIWDKISHIYKLPNSWDRDSLTICKERYGTLMEETRSRDHIMVTGSRIKLFDSIQVKVLSGWSEPITFKSEENSIYLKNVRNIFSDNTRVKVYKFRISSVITTVIHYGSNGEINSVFFAIDTDFYLNWAFAGDDVNKITDWTALPTDRINIDMIRQVKTDMQNLLISILK